MFINNSRWQTYLMLLLLPVFPITILEMDWAKWLFNSVSFTLIHIQLNGIYSFKINKHLWSDFWFSFFLFGRLSILKDQKRQYGINSCPNREKELWWLASEWRHYIIFHGMSNLYREEKHKITAHSSATLIALEKRNVKRM